MPSTARHPEMIGEIRPHEDPRSTLYNSDGQIFSDAGIPVVLFMEDYDINRSGYHDSKDTMAGIDLDYGVGAGRDRDRERRPRRGPRPSWSSSFTPGRLVGPRTAMRLKTGKCPGFVLAGPAIGSGALTRLTAGGPARDVGAGGRRLNSRSASRFSEETMAAWTLGGRGGELPEVAEPGQRSPLARVGGLGLPLQERRATASNAMSRRQSPTHPDEGRRLAGLRDLRCGHSGKAVLFPERARGSPSKPSKGRCRGFCRF